MPTVNQIRSAMNKELNSERKITYKKHEEPDLRVMAMHLLGQFGEKEARKDVKGVKLKALKTAMSKMVSGEGYYSAIEEIKGLIIEAKERAQRRLIHGKKTSITSHDEHYLTVCNLPSAKFYASREWRAIRYIVLRESKQKCELCGSSPSSGGAQLHVDHIKPRSYYPELALMRENLQVLCEECNMGKSNKYNDDWRNSND